MTDPAPARPALRALANGSFPAQERREGPAPARVDVRGRADNPTGQGRVLRRWPRFIPGFDTPVTSLLCVALGLAAFLEWTSPSLAGHWSQFASTNVVNLREHPLTALLLSLVVGSGFPSDLLIQIAVAGAVLERRAGSARVAAVAACAHVVPSLVTEAWVHVAVLTGASPAGQVSRSDVGASYAAFGLTAAAVWLLPRRGRPGTGALVAARVLVPACLGGDMTAWGHLLAVLIGAFVGSAAVTSRAGQGRSPEVWCRWRVLLAPALAAAVTAASALALWLGPLTGQH